MKVILTGDVLQSESDHIHLDAIIYRIMEGAHEWEVTDSEAIWNSQWMQGARAQHKELLTKATTHGAYPTIHKQRVTVTAVSDPNDPWALAPAVAAKFLAQPLIILVENAFTDSMFINAVLRTLASRALLELCQKVSDAIRCQGAGGIGEIPKHVKDIVKESKDKGVPPRLVVLADSDGTAPGLLSGPAQAVKACCLKHNIPCLILRKRAIENYIPDELFNRWSSEPSQTSTRSRMAALLRLGADQRDHFPVKKGFSAGCVSPEENELYSSVPPEDRELLKKGFGDDIIQLFDTYRGDLSKAGLCHRAGNGGKELDDLAGMIAAAI
ncbi:MAG: hypothetical protein HQL90_11595 [Magnetococcales bacterium]|nr:hypothetical protein [Magnetococcales bacterium]